MRRLCDPQPNCPAGEVFALASWGYLKKCLQIAVGHGLADIAAAEAVTQQVLIMTRSAGCDASAQVQPARRRSVAMTLLSYWLTLQPGVVSENRCIMFGHRLRINNGSGNARGEFSARCGSVEYYIRTGYTRPLWSVGNFSPAAATRKAGLEPTCSCDKTLWL